MPTSAGVRSPRRLLSFVLLVLLLPAAGCAVHAGEPGLRAERRAGVPPPAPGRLHALLLNGGGRKEINYQSHLHHIRRAYELLREDGIPAANITIFSGDGADPTPDLAGGLAAPFDHRQEAGEGAPIAPLGARQQGVGLHGPLVTG